ncbi:MAG TPA: alpha/beta hydrolase [Gemmatimonadales bacterium]|nr:alpha/beta hydrolase [Gemmatimonadales bacterium]
MLLAVVLVPSATGAAQQVLSKTAGTPVVVATQGYFFVGGQYFTAADGQFMADQMYVEFQIPQNVKHPYPIVLIHGGGLTGTYMMGTSDGREGWSTFFLRQGYAVYVVDQTGRGKSAYHTDVYGPMSRGNALGIQQRFTAFQLYNQWPKAGLHTQWPGPGLIGDPVFDQFYASEVEGMASAVNQQSTMQAAGAALLDKIGPAILLTHSQSGPYGWLIADARPTLVKGLLQTEPSGPPLHSVTFLGPPTWFTDGPVQFPWGMTAIPMTYAPAVSDPSQLTFVPQAVADNPGVIRCWRQAEPARQLPNLQHVPILIVTSEAGYHSTYDQCTSEYLTQAGVPNAQVNLGDVGIHGNGHMMMIEKNNLDIAAFMQSWLEQNVEKGVRVPNH